MLVGRSDMGGTDDRILDPDGRGDVRVANPTEGVYVFYSEGAEAFIRTDCVVDVSSLR